MKGKLNIKHFFVLVTTLVLVLLQPLHSLQHVYSELLAEKANHEHVSSKQKDQSNSEHNKKCSICEFTIQPYLVVDSIEIPSVYLPLYAQLIGTKAIQYYFQTNSHYYLRGPPTQFLV